MTVRSGVRICRHEELMAGAGATVCGTAAAEASRNAARLVAIRSPKRVWVTTASMPDRTSFAVTVWRKCCNRV